MTDDQAREDEVLRTLLRTPPKPHNSGVQAKVWKRPRKPAEKQA